MDGTEGGGSTAVSSTTVDNGTLFGCSNVSLCGEFEEVDGQLFGFASRDIGRRWPFAYGVNVDAMEVRRSIGGASFIVTRRGERSYNLGDGLREDIGVLVGDDSKNLTRLARRLFSSSVNVAGLTSFASRVLLFPKRLRDTSCSRTAFASESKKERLFSSIHLSLCIMMYICGSVSLSARNARSLDARS